MDPTALYYALSTIAQCAAALAALIGFFGLWRLDRLRAEREQAIQLIYRQLNFTDKVTGTGIGQEIARLGEEYFIQKAEAYVQDVERAHGDDGPVGLQLKQATARWRAIPGEQRQLMNVLQRFLRRTLVILALAISGLVIADALYAWVLTRWLTRLLVLLAAYRLWRDTAAVMREATRSPHVFATLALIFALASLAPPLLLAAEPPPRTLIRSTPGGYKVYSYENAAGETVEETENPLGKLISRRFYRPAPPACAYLRSLGLNTDRYWRDDGEQVFHCLSPYKELGTAADPLGLSSKNNLAYYVDGDAERIHQMKLVLDVYHQNVKSRSGANQAHQPLGQAAKRLTQEALKTPLPKAAEQAIAAGKTWWGTVKAATLELIRDEWPTGKGYELHFLVRPAVRTPCPTTRTTSLYFGCRVSSSGYSKL
jgi:hypothetical protein